MITFIPPGEETASLSVWPLGRTHSSGFIDHCLSCPSVTLDGPEAKLSGGPFCYCYVKSNIKAQPGHVPQQKHTLVRSCTLALRARPALLVLLGLITLVFSPRAHHQARLLLALVLVPSSPQFSTGAVRCPFLSQTSLGLLEIALA